MEQYTHENEPVTFRISTILHGKTQNRWSAHTHPFHEIFYLHSGECTAFIDHQIYLFHEGDFVIVPSGTLHRTNYDAAQNKRTIISFARNFIQLGSAAAMISFQKEYENPGVISVPENRRAYVEELLRRLKDENEQPDEFSQEFLRALLTELLLFLIRCHNYKNDHLQITTPQHGEMQDVADYIYEHYKENLGLNELSAIFHLSPSSLSRKFKQSTGFGIREYLVGIRVQAASRLLLNSEDSVTEIAYACGFNDSNYFGDAFRRVKGVSPTAYRQGKELL